VAVKVGAEIDMIVRGLRKILMEIGAKMVIGGKNGNGNWGQKWRSGQNGLEIGEEEEEITSFQGQSTGESVKSTAMQYLE